MSGEYGNDFVSISDEEGNEYVLEHLDTIEFDGCYYMAFLPADMDEDDENYGTVYLKKESPDSDDLIVPTEEEMKVVHEIFMRRQFPEDFDGNSY